MTPAVYNLSSHISGDTWNGLSISIQINDADPTYELESVKMQVRKSTFSKVLLEFSTDNGKIVITDPVTWTFIIQSQVISLCPDTYIYDIQTIDANGAIKTYVNGTWTISGDVTRLSN